MAGGRKLKKGKKIDVCYLRSQLPVFGRTLSVLESIAVGATH